MPLNVDPSVKRIDADRDSRFRKAVGEFFHRFLQLVERVFFDHGFRRVQQEKVVVRDFRFWGSKYDAGDSQG